MKPFHLIIVFLAWCFTGLWAEEPAGPVGGSTPDKDYHIAERDVIDFKIYNQLDMASVQRVTATGEVRLPLVGTVQLAGRTLRDAEQLLEKLYRDGGFFVKPQVILSVQAYRDRYVSVLGQVKNPERIALGSESVTIGILQAVTRVGGFTRIARTDAVQVLRTTSGREERITINMEELLKPKGNTPVEEFQLSSGDIVFVPERAF